MGELVAMRPTGHYVAHEVGRLAGVSGHTIGQWARNGYIRSSVSEHAPRVYAYQDIAEAMVVHVLRDHHIAYATIRRAIEWLRDQAGGDWPLTDADLSVYRPGYDDAPRARGLVLNTLFGYVEVDERRPVRDHDRLVLGGEFLQNVRADLSRGGWAARQLPDLRHIEVNPARLSGRPVVAGTRVAADFVARLARQPDGPLVLRRDYDLTDEQVHDAIRWWDAVQQYEAA